MGTTPRDFDACFDELAVIAYRVAYRLLGSRPDAEDVTQEALARASLQWRRVAPYAEAWVTRVTTNLALGLLRRRRPGRGAVVAEPAAADQTVADRQALVAGLRSLPRRQREAVSLRYLADLPEAEVAAALGCSVGSVKQHTSRGLAALRRRLDPGPHDPDEGDLHVRTAR